jgi:hypothetical protein
MKGIYVVRVDVLDNSIEKDFNRWYSFVHLPDLMKIPELIVARRFYSKISSPKYLSLYEFPDKETLIKGKDSEEMAYAKSDTKKRWTGKISNGERYYALVKEKLFHDVSFDKGKVLFLSVSTEQSERISNLIDEFKEKFKIEGCLKLETINKEPLSLPDVIFLCTSRLEEDHKILEFFSKETEYLGIYNPLISYYKVLHSSDLY